MIIITKIIDYYENINDRIPYILFPIKESKEFVSLDYYSQKYQERGGCSDMIDRHK